MEVHPPTLQRGVKIVFGLELCPELPSGFSLLKAERGTIRKAEDWEGKQYLITLEPNRLVPILKQWNHNTQADFENAIPF